METIAKIIRKSPAKGDIGIEIEVEGVNVPHIETEFWNTVSDGSLRGESNEYVFNKPIKIHKVRNALEELQECFNLHKTKLQFSFRTSVHVHLNVSDLTGVQYLNTLYTALLLEQPMINYCGKSRIGNRFCLRTSDAEGIIPIISSVFRDVRNINYLDGNQIRYSAINIHATKKFGSIEFRGMRGTMDLDVLSNWCSAIYLIKQFGLKFDNPLQIQELYESLPSGYDFMNQVFGSELSKVFDYDLLNYEMSSCLSLTMGLPHEYSNSIIDEEESESYEEKAEPGVESNIIQPRERVFSPSQLSEIALSEVRTRIIEALREARTPD